MGYELEGVITHHIDGALVLRQGIVESHLVHGQALVFTALPGFPDLPSKVDQFLEHLDRADGIGVVTGYGLLQAVREPFGLDHVRAAAGRDLVIEQLFQCFQRQVLFLHLLDFGQKLLRQD